MFLFSNYFFIFGIDLKSIKKRYTKKKQEEGEIFEGEGERRRRRRRRR
jgi:hypothetical protein